MKDCGPNLAKYMKKSKMNEPEHDLADLEGHDGISTDDFKAEDDGEDDHEGPLSKYAAKNDMKSKRLAKG